MRKKLVIKISRDLPPRARQLHPEELKAVFGGCADDGKFCLSDSDCCNDICIVDWERHYCAVYY